MLSLTIDSPDYPQSLKNIHKPPPTLYYQGDLKPLSKPTIAVVGSRRISGYGKLVTEQITAALAQAGVTVISGLAFGVDTVAHQTALREEGQTVAVLGGGLNNVFPAENQHLAKQMTLVTEYPPDYPNFRWNFLARNRIIAGLSRAVIVTEAAQRSGALTTAREATEQGKDVYVVPGPITSETSRGCLYLIRDGAKLVITVDELIQDLQLPPLPPKTLNLSSEEQKLLTALGDPKTIDDLHHLLHLPVSQLSATLIRLEIKGAVKNLGAGRYLKIC